MSTIGFFNAIAQNQSNYNSPHGGKIKKVGTYAGVKPPEYDRSSLIPYPK